MMMDDGGDMHLGDQAAKVCVNSFLRRPSLKPTAFQTISGFMNNLVLAAHRPGDACVFYAAMVFLLKDRAAWAISGEMSVLLFSGGVLERSSSGSANSRMGLSPVCRPELCEPFRLSREEKALLICSNPLLAAVSVQEIEAALRESNGPAQWQERILSRLNGPDEAVSMLCAFIPPPPRGLSALFSGRT